MDTSIPTPSSDWNNRDCLILIASENKLRFSSLEWDIQKPGILKKNLVLYQQILHWKEQCFPPLHAIGVYGGLKIKHQSFGVFKFSRD